MPWRPTPAARRREGATGLIIVVGLLTFVAAVVFFLTSCAPARPACTAEDKAAIEARYVASVTTVCAGKTRATCPEYPTLAAWRAKEEEPCR